MNIENFELLEELGRGGYGIVYKAHDQALNRIVAVKVLHPLLLMDEDLISKFKTEAQIAAKLEHPNLVQIFEFAENDGRAYFVMSYMSGGSLKSLLIKNGGLPIDRALDILEEIGKGLSYAHSLNIVHRDLKPGNILFDDKGIGHVSDLGLAKIIQTDGSISMSGPGVIGGTPSYMAPEVWRGKEASPATDVYSLACIFVEMISGRPLFTGNSIPEIMLKHFEPVKLPPQLPPEWKEILNKAIEKDSEDRYQKVDDFVSDLRKTQVNLLSNSADEKPVLQSEALVNENSKINYTSQNIKKQNQTQDSGNRNEDNFISIPKSKSGFFYLIFSLLSISAMYGFYQLGRNASRPIPPDSPSRVSQIITSPTNVPGLSTVTESPVPTETLNPTETASPTETTSPAETSVPVLGSSKIRAKDGAEMLYIPEGKFEMGSDSGQEDEKPVRNIFLDGYWIDKYEVTNGLYQKCVSEGVCKEPSQFDSNTRVSYYSNPVYNNYPVIFVDWNQANTYCQWAGGALPTEAQWEKAARGTNGGEYPWGNARPNRPFGSFVDPNMRDTSEVGLYPDGASFYGTMDMAGNVWEWVGDWYKAYYDPDETENPQGPENGEYRIRRGGAWYSGSIYLRSAYRYNYAYPNEVDRGTGFRCVVPGE